MATHRKTQLRESSKKEDQASTELARHSFFRYDNDDVPPWAKTTTTALDDVCGNLWDNLLAVTLTLPEPQSAKEAYTENQDLHGEVLVHNQEFAESSLRLRIPLPHHGVFVKRRNKSATAGLAVWSAWLGELPGFRYLRRPGNSDTVFWRVGLPGGGYVQAPCGELSDEQRARSFPRRLRIFPPRSALPAFLHNLYDAHGAIDLPLSGRTPKRNDFWDSIHELATAHWRSGNAVVSDEDDLEYRALVTYPVWLKARLAEVLIANLIAVSGDDTAALIEGFQEKQPVDEELAKRLWEKLATREQAEAIAWQLYPPGWVRIQSSTSKKRFSPLQWIEPVNPVDLAALLTQVRRYPLPHEALENLPAPYRQNHPSFRGRICPVQSPESELVGLSLHLARGAKVDWDGRIIPATKDQPQEELGFGSNLVPFYEHNDGTRCMMGAKNLRQAVPVAKRQSPAIKTGGENRIQEFVKPLVDCGVCEDAFDHDGNLALGVDLLVGYLPWQGLNVDDAIVVGEHVVDQGLLDVEIRQRYKLKQPAGWMPTSLCKPSWFSGKTALDSLLLSPEEIGGLAPEGVELSSGSLIAAFGIEGREDRTVREIRYLDRSPATLRHINFYRDEQHLWKGGELRYELAKKLKLGLGDKLMGRHGNKGVVGAVLPPDQMPRLPDTDNIPKDLRGRTLDILLNPHGVISRMNLGQLLETHIGWLLHTGFRQEEFVRHGLPNQTEIGQAFLQALDHDKVQRLLEKSGLDRFGRIQLVLPDGTKTLSPVVVGFQHIVRLKQIPELKSQARRGGIGAAYSRETGQAAHGRIVGGGQRAGEMEVWALAGHQANYLLEEMLGAKADSVLAPLLIEPKPKNPSFEFDGFAARLRDWLFALMIDLHIEHGTVSLSFADVESARKQIGGDKKVVNSEIVSDAVNATFGCQPRGKKGCDFALLDDAKLTVQLPRGQNTPLSLRFDDLLKHLGLLADSTLQMKRGRYVLPLQSLLDQKPAGELQISFSSSKTQVKAVVSADLKLSPPNWPASLNGLALCCQFAVAKGQNAEPALVLEEFLKEDGRWRFGKMCVACPQHKTTPLKGKPPFVPTWKPVDGGLFDPSLFGSLASAGATDDSKRWGYIELPVPVPYPVKSFLGEHEEPSVFLAKQGISPESLPLLSLIPVLPPRYRLPHKREGITYQCELVRCGYIPVIKACEQYNAAQDEQQRETAAAVLRERVNSLFRLIVDQLTGKEGLIRHDGLGRRVDRSARLVIVPNPKLQWDQVGVPTAVLLELLGDELREWVTCRQVSDDLLAVISVMTANHNDADLIKAWSWRKSAKDKQLLEQGYTLLSRFLEDRPELLVVLNRQPSLHRDSIQAFRPVPLPPQIGDVLQISPLVCKGFGADFDGDEMAIHVPVSAQAQQEAQHMLPSRNMFSLATGKPSPSYEQDFVLGMYWLSRSESTYKHVLIESLPGDCCRQWVERNPELDQEAGMELLKHLAVAHTNVAPSLIWNLSNLAYDCCSRMGVSFGFYDLAALSASCGGNIETVVKALDPDKPDGINDALDALVKESLLAVLVGGKDMFGRSGLQFASMALSGARGKQQVRQLIAARGFLSPGLTAHPEQFVIRNSLLQGMSPSQAFLAGMNVRSSMCDKKLGTGEAGYLTRRLVTALWSTHIIEEDCGDTRDSRNPITCRSRDGVCAACYGELPGGKGFPTIGFPAGLIAAQSIGERGTQLSMQSFHTGVKAFTIQSVLNILDGREEMRYFDDPKYVNDFLSEMMKSKPGEKKKPYKDLDEKHFQVLWRVIHNSPEHTLRSATHSVGLLTGIGFEQQSKRILVGACSSACSTVDEPVARVFLNLFGARTLRLEVTSK
jgi:hypothetical protein